MLYRPAGGMVAAVLLPGRWTLGRPTTRGTGALTMTWEKSYPQLFLTTWHLDQPKKTLKHD